jgi:hypothetical protein
MGIIPGVIRRLFMRARPMHTFSYTHFPASLVATLPPIRFFTLE